MAVLQAALSIPSSASSSSSPAKPYLSSKGSTPIALTLRIPSFAPPVFSLNLRLGPSSNNSRRVVSVLCSVTEEEISSEEKTSPEEKAEEGSQKSQVKRKLFVFNLPWSMNINDISELFGQCGTVTKVEIIKQKDGKNRGFAFVTMASGEEAQAVVDKFDTSQVSGRIIRVNFARRFKKPTPKPPTSLPAPEETRHKLYVSNLPWKARSTHLRELFTSADFNLVSARVVFADPEGRASGYGFVSFATREEAEAAISKLNGKEIMGRPISLKFSLRSTPESDENNTIQDIEDNSSEEKPVE